KSWLSYHIVLKMSMIIFTKERGAPGKGDAPFLYEIWRCGRLAAPRLQDLDLIGLLIRQFFGFRLGQAQFQDAVLEAGLHILGLDLVTHIEAAGAGAGVPLLTDVMSLVVLLVPVLVAAGRD